MQIQEYLQQKWLDVKASAWRIWQALKHWFKPDVSQPQDSLADEDIFVTLLANKETLKLLYLAYFSLAFGDINRAIWATYWAYTFSKEDTGISEKDKFLQDVLLQRMYLAWGDHYHQQADISQAINWYQLISLHHPFYYMQANHQLASIALGLAEDIKQIDEHAPEIKQCETHAYTYLKQAAALNDQDAKRFLSHVQHGLTFLPSSFVQPDFYQKIDQLLNAIVQRYQQKGEIIMPVQQIAEENGSDNHLNQHDVIDIAHQKFAKEAETKLQQSLELANEIHQQAFQQLDTINLPFVNYVYNIIARYENSLQISAPVMQPKYPKVFTEIQDFLNLMKRFINTADATHNEIYLYDEVSNFLNNESKYPSHFGKHNFLLVFYSDPFKFNDLRVKLNNLCEYYKSNNLTLRIGFNKNFIKQTFQEIELRNIEQLNSYHHNLVTIHQESADILVEHIHNIRDELKLVKNDIQNLQAEIYELKNDPEYKKTCGKLEEQIQEQKREFEQQKHEFEQQKHQFQQQKQEFEEQRQEFEGQKQIFENQKLDFKKQISDLKTELTETNEFLRQQEIRNKQKDQVLQEQKLILEERNQLLTKFLEQITLEREEAKQARKEAKYWRKIAKKIPEDFICPITHDIMRNPVMAKDGHSYEKNAIEKWFNQNFLNYGHYTSPLTNEAISDELLPNHTLRKAIEDFQIKAKEQSPMMRQLAGSTTPLFNQRQKSDIAETSNSSASTLGHNL